MNTKAMIELMHKAMTTITVPPPQVIHCHPNNVKYFREATKYGVEVVGSPLIPERDEFFELPKGDAFVEYEPSDERWMRPLGIGVTSKIACYAIRMPNSMKFDFNEQTTIKTK